MIHRVLERPEKLVFYIQCVNIQLEGIWYEAAPHSDIRAAFDSLPIVIVHHWVKVKLSLLRVQFESFIDDIPR